MPPAAQAVRQIVWGRIAVLSSIVLVLPTATTTPSIPHHTFQPPATSTTNPSIRASVRLSSSHDSSLQQGRVSFNVCPENDASLAAFLETALQVKEDDEGEDWRDQFPREAKTNEIIVPAEKEIPMQCTCASSFEPYAHMLEPFTMRLGCAASISEVFVESHGWQKIWGKEYDKQGNARDVLRTYYNYGSSTTQVAQGLGNPVGLDFVRVNHHISDYYGLTDQPIIAAPGGDLAIFVTGLHAYSVVSDRTLTFVEIKELLASYMTEADKASFYYGTTKAAVDTMMTELNLDDLNLDDPPEEAIVRAKIMKKATSGLGQGSTVIGTMISQPGIFRLKHAEGRVPLAQLVLQAFFTLLWDKKEAIYQKFRLVELEGSVDAVAVVKIYAPNNCASQGIQPLITPWRQKICGSTGCKKQFYLVYPQAINSMMDQVTTFFAQQDGAVIGDIFKGHMKSAYNIIENWAVNSARNVDDYHHLPVLKVVLKGE